MFGAIDQWLTSGTRWIQHSPLALAFVAYDEVFSHLPALWASLFSTICVILVVRLVMKLL